MGIKIKYKDPSLNEFSTDDIVINVQSGSLFFKSNTTLYKLQGDNQSTTDADSYISPTHSINNYNHAQTIVGQATVAAEGNGIRETWTNTNGTQYAHAWLLLGDTPSEGGGGGGGTPATSIVPKTNALLRPSFSGM